MPVSEAMQRLIMSGATALDLANQARTEGVKDLRESGLIKVKQGLTSLDEVLSTTNA
jgi:type IV pilus assembly protein PilB